MLNNFYPGFIIRHPVFLITFIIAIPAWIVAFAGQCAAEARLTTVNGTPVVRYLWYSIWVQLACIIHLFIALATDQLAAHRFQLVIFLAIAEVFAVLGTSDFIFLNEGTLIAVGAGCLLLAMVDLVWIIYLTSEEGTAVHGLLTTGGNGGLSNHSRPRRGSTFGGGHGIENGTGGGMNTYASTPRMNNAGGGFTMGGSSGMGGGYAPAATETTPQKVNAGVVRDEFGNHSPVASEEHYKHRAKAMYAYNASPDDPNEVSFAKGDILEVMDNSGKWFSVRTPTGQTGIAPSNYLTML